MEHSQTVALIQQLIGVFFNKKKNSTLNWIHLDEKGHTF